MEQNRIRTMDQSLKGEGGSFNGKIYMMVLFFSLEKCKNMPVKVRTLALPVIAVGKNLACVNTTLYFGGGTVNLYVGEFWPPGLRKLFPDRNCKNQGT